MEIRPLDLPVVFLSYDEPCKEQNYEFLLLQRPDCLRVDGVLGSDQAHKACAQRVNTDWLCIVDADSRPKRQFWTEVFTLSEDLLGLDPVLSFSAQNSVNGLCYGNGGIKIWPRRVIEEMQTHEAGLDPGSDLDFCWVLDYVLMPGVWSTTQINHTQEQAWRAGFREGVKFSLIEGRECKDPDQWQRQIEAVNQRRLALWQMVGTDTKNGLWAILGARQGFYRALFTDWSTSDAKDFRWLAQEWQRQTDDPLEEIVRLGGEILDSLSLEITARPLEPQVSRWFKQVYPQAARTEPKRMKS